MSAVFGIVSAGRPVERGDVDRMSARLEAFGRDGGGIWMGELAGLGQRLQRVLPEDVSEVQPRFSADDAVVLVSDGRIDNRRELAGRLEVHRSAPDSAWILAAYEKWGRGFASHLVGAFALAIWDRRERTLLLARSPQCERPLYYHSSGDRLVFASHPFGLFAAGLRPAFDEAFLADYLARERTDPDASFFRGVRRVVPGHTLLFRDGRVTSTPHWTWPERELHFATDDDYVGAFRDVYDRAVSDHLRSATGVGIMLSGGYDSSSVAVTAAPQLAAAGRTLSSFTEVPPPGFKASLDPARYASEQPFVEAIARRYPNIRATFLDSSGRFFLDGADAMFSATATPNRTPSNRAWQEDIFREAGRQSVGVMLNGIRGNVTVSWGGGGLLPQLVRAGGIAEAVAEARAMGGSWSRSARVFAGAGILPLLPAAPRRILTALRHPSSPGIWRGGAWRAIGVVNPDFAGEHCVRDRARARGADFRDGGVVDSRQLRAAVIARGTDLFDGLYAGYQALFGPESRDPTCDQRVIEFCLSVPERQYQRRGERRWLVRRAMRDRWPPEILNNPQRGFPVAAWFERMKAAGGRLELELRYVEESDLARRALDLSRLRRLISEINTRDATALSTLADYRHTLEFGLMMGYFIRWVESLPGQ